MNTSANSPHAPAPTGLLCLVLHAHLPYVRHPEQKYVMEENWLYEALTESYIPLLRVLEKIVSEGIALRLTLSLSPTLCAMLTDQLLMERYQRHVEKCIELAGNELVRTKNDAVFNASARMYHRKFTECRDYFRDTAQRDLLSRFRALQRSGALELITSGATHAYLPTMQESTRAVRAQIQIAVEEHERLLGAPPRGFWLPECGYYPGIERFLHDNGISWFFLDSHGVLFAEPRPAYGLYAPVFCTEAPVAAFGRDVESSRSVWSSDHGYPGDPDYREYYRDIGFDLDLDYIRPYIDPIGIRINTGVKYYRITGKTDEKEPYDYARACEKAKKHAADFIFNRCKQIDYLAAIMDRRPLIVAPYDAELFGHWWYEGPQWLDQCIRLCAENQRNLSLVTPSDYLAAYPTNQVCAPSLSSWGYAGYSQMWIDSTNDWIYRHLHSMERRMSALACHHTKASPLVRRALNQMARELLLAQSSDWAFIMKNKTMDNYARRRTREHIANFHRLHDQIAACGIDESDVSDLESRNAIFPHIDYRTYA